MKKTIKGCGCDEKPIMHEIKSIHGDSLGFEVTRVMCKKHAVEYRASLAPTTPKKKK
jgi:hypothetical protein